MKLRFWKREKKKIIPEGVLYRGTAASIDAYPQVVIGVKEQIQDEPIEDDNYVEVDYIAQCFGNLKSGARCSRIVDNAEYCWQHKLK